MKKLSAGLAKALPHLWGCLLFGILIYLLAQNTWVFVTPGYERFWDDAAAFASQSPGHKTPEELIRLYGEPAVRRYILEPDFAVSYLPSQRAAFATLLGYTRVSNVQGDKDGTIPWVFVGAFALLAFYLPTTIAVRALARGATRLACRSPAARELHAAYYRRRSWWTALLAFVCVAALCGVNAWRSMSAEVQALGFRLIDLTMALVVLAYFSGLWTQCVAYLVDGIFLTSRIDPSRTLWNEIIAVALTGPILYLVYQNTLLSVLAGVVAGLAQGYFAKLTARSREAQGKLPASSSESGERTVSGALRRA